MAASESTPYRLASAGPLETGKNGVTGREFATVENQVLELRHDIKQLRTAIDSLVDIQRDQDRSISELRVALEQTRTRITTGLAIGTAVVSAGAWALSLAARFIQ